jgi:hypothetical protein
MEPCTRFVIFVVIDVWNWTLDVCFHFLCAGRILLYSYPLRCPYKKTSRGKRPGEIGGHIPTLSTRLWKTVAEISCLIMLRSRWSRLVDASWKASWHNTYNLLAK